MPRIEVSLPEELVSQFERMVDEEFVNRDEAVEELLSSGIEAYTREFDDEEEENLAEEYADDMWDTADMGTQEDDDML